MHAVGQNPQSVNGIDAHSDEDVEVGSWCAAHHAGAEATGLRRKDSWVKRIEKLPWTCFWHVDMGYG